MLASATTEIKERERINAHLAKFWSLPTWTPAMGALLVSGAAPLPGTHTIPKVVAALAEPQTAATQIAFSDAARVLERWRESWEDAIEMGRATKSPTSLQPFEFLLWCQEEYENAPDWNKPGWLLYWLVFTGMEVARYAPLPVPAPIVDRAAELEGFAAVINRGSQTNPTPSSAPSRSITQRMIAKVSALIEEDGRSPINGSIVKAIKEANSVATAAVWHQLRLIALKGDHGLKYKDEQTLWIPSGEQDGENLFRKSFGQLLRRYRSRAEEQLISSK